MNGAVGLNCFRTAFGTHVTWLVRWQQHKPACSLARGLSTCWLSPAPTRHRRSLPSHPIPWRSGPRRSPSRGLGIRTLNLKKLGIGGYQVPKHYLKVPRQYKDEIGLPFLNRDLEEQEVEKIFGPQMKVDRGNQLLRILHGRRVAGTLHDPGLKKNLQQFPKAQQKTALTWLRKTVPVDEEIMAGLRAEDELAAIEKKMSGEEEKAADDEGGKSVGDAVQDYLKTKFKMYKDQEMGMEVYGVSVLDQMVARNRANREAAEKEREAKREAERKKREEEEAKLGPLAKLDKDKPRQLSPRMQQWVSAATSDLKEPPKMAAWERLLPSFVFTLLVLGACFAYAEFYRPPAPSQRLFRDLPPSVAAIGVLIMMNLAGFFLWRLPPLWAMMNRYALIVVATPKPLSLLGAMFSHQTWSHLFHNTAALALVGSQLHDEVGRGNFLAVYIGSGTLAGLGSLTYNVLMGRLTTTVLGVSAAWYGIMAAYFWMHRFDGFKVFGLPPDPFSGVPGLALIALPLAWNIASLFSAQAMAKIDIAGHLGGMLVGMLGGAWLERKKRAGELLPDPQWADWQDFGLYGFVAHQLFGPLDDEGDDDDDRGLKPGVQR